MEYPKAIMSISEMEKFGYTKYYLTCACRSIDGPKFATRISSRGKWFIDTAEFEKWRAKKIKDQVRR